MRFHHHRHDDHEEATLDDLIGLVVHLIEVETKAQKEMVQKLFEYKLSPLDKISIPL